MKKYANFFLLLTLISLGACGPIYDTEYHYQTPPTHDGQMCASNCLERMSSCKTTCTAQEADCRRISSLEAENDYLEYVNERQRKGEKIKKSKSDFEFLGSCSNDCEESCENTHRICHSNCGGNVVEHRTCTAFCN